MTAILLWSILLTAQYVRWADYWDCMEPCYVRFYSCLTPCSSEFDDCQTICNAKHSHRQRLAELSVYVGCATGPGRTWQQCRKVWLSFPDPFGWCPKWFTVCEDRLPHECQELDTDADGDVDLYDLAVLMGE